MKQAHCPVVLGGCHRSGTTVVRCLLDNHTAFSCGPEIKFFRDYYDDYSDDPLRHLRFFQTARSALSDEDLFAIMGQAFIAIHARAMQRAGKRRWADKNPENALYLEAWQRLLGNEWMYVHIVRNPLDTLASIKEHVFPLTIPRDWPGRIAHYRRHVEAGLDWVAAHPERSFLMVYEELVAEPVRAMTRLMAFLGEEMEPAQLVLRPGSGMNGLGDPKARRTTSVHADSVGRWRQVLEPDEARSAWAALQDAWKRVDPDGRIMKGP